MQQMVPQQQKAKRKHRSLGFWIAFTLALVVTIALIVVIVWLSITQSFDKLASFLGIGASIVAIVTGPLLLLFTITSFPSREKTEDHTLLYSSSPDALSPPLDTPVQALEEKQTIWNVPYRRNPFFTGRESILTQLHNNLTGGKATTLTQPQTINGLGGIGKTQCAVEYAYQYKDEYTYVLWANAASHETMIASFVALASLLQIAERNEQEQEKIAEAVTRWLETHHKWLLILDNADDLEMALGFLPARYDGYVLLTSRTQATGGLAHNIELREMDLQEGTTMLLRRANVLKEKQSLEKPSPDERKQAEAIVKAMGGLPLALDQAGAYIEETQCTLQEYLQAYQHRQADLLKRRGINKINHPEAVGTTWSLSFEAIERNGPLAAALLRACAFLAPDDIPEELLVEGANKLGPSFQSLASDPTLLQEAVGELLRYSLIRRDTNAHIVFVHRLVQAVLQQTMSQEEQQQWGLYVIQALDSIFPNPESTTWAQCQRYLPHALACVEYISRWNISILQAASLLNKTGFYLQDRAQYADAEPLFERALRIHEEQLGAQHPDTALSLNNLAELYLAQGKYEGVEPLLQRALGIREEQLGAQHLDTAQSLNNLAELYRIQGKYEEAEPLYKRALGIHEEQLGAQHPGTALSLNNLAGLYRIQGKYEEAEPLLQRALRIYEEQLGAQHPNTALGLNNLAELYRVLRKYEEAEPLYKRALGIREAQLGAQHPDTALSLNNLALLYYTQSKYEEAEPLYKRALRINEEQLGAQHPNTALSLNNLALLYRAQGKYEEAEALYERALRIFEQQLGPDHPSTVTVRANYEALQDEMKRRS